VTAQLQIIQSLNTFSLSSSSITMIYISFYSRYFFTAEFLSLNFKILKLTNSAVKKHLFENKRC